MKIQKQVILVLNGESNIIDKVSLLCLAKLKICLVAVDFVIFVLLILLVIAHYGHNDSIAGDRIPIKELDANIVAMYLQEMKVKFEKTFIPYKKLCKTGEVL